MHCTPSAVGDRSRPRSSTSTSDSCPPTATGRRWRQAVVLRGLVAVRIDASVWHEEVERFAPRSPARVAAEGERRRLERAGISASLLLRCDPAGTDGTRLGGLVKAYVPISDGPPSTRPFGLVFAAGVDAEGRVYLELVAFGERHPRPATRSVYERAHRRLHGRYPDQ